MSGSPHSIEQAMRVTDAFLAGFNAQDWNAHFDTYNFPHIRIAGGEVKVLWTIGFTGSRAIQYDPGEKESACRPQKRMKSERS